MLRLETLRKEGGRDGRAKVALISRKLAAVAKEVEDIEGGEAVRPSRPISSWPAILTSAADSGND
jgi:hypothetical protein